MKTCFDERNLSSKVDKFMSAFRLFLDRLFISNDQTINANIILNELQQKTIDINKLTAFFETLPEDEWNIKVFLNNIPQLNEIFGISDTEIKKHCVTNIKDSDILVIRYNIVVDSMLEYSKFATEFYDALKYNTSADISPEKLRLLNELMLVFNFIKKISKELFDYYENRKFSKSNIKNLNISRIPIEFLMLRILYVIINLKNGEKEKIKYYTQLISKERISLMYQKIDKS